MTDSRPARGVDHIGVTVPDIDAAAGFLEAAFGVATVYDVQRLSDAPMAGEQVERELGMPRGAGIVHMRLMRLGTGPSVEPRPAGNSCCLGTGSDRHGIGPRRSCQARFIRNPEWDWGKCTRNEPAWQKPTEGDLVDSRD